MGTVTADAVLERAREIALINGRGPNHFTQEDFLEAKWELLGGTASSNGEAVEETIAGLTQWDESPAATGHPVPKGELEDEQSLSAQLVEEGVEEAEHEQMVESVRNARNHE
jgi:hypothetical protein